MSEDLDGMRSCSIAEYNKPVVVDAAAVLNHISARLEMMCEEGLRKARAKPIQSIHRTKLECVHVALKARICTDG